jgi:hypothetical protein
MSVNDAAVAAADVSTVVVEPAKQVPPLVPPPAAKPDAPTEPEAKPPWLDERLARAREAAKKEAWKELGFESPEDAKKAADERKAAAEAKKTESQKRAEAETALAAEKARVAEMAAALSAHAESEMQKLTDTQRDAVKAAAGDDPTAQLKMITALRPTWVGAAAPAATATQDTAPGRTAPKDGGEGPPPDPKAVYESLKESNPIVAARYALRNGLIDLK